MSSNDVVEVRLDEMRIVKPVSEVDVVPFEMIDVLKVKKAHERHWKALQYFRMRHLVWISMFEMNVLTRLDLKRKRKVEKLKKRWKEWFEEKFDVEKFRKAGFVSVVFKDVDDYDCTFRVCLKRKDGSLWKIKEVQVEGKFKFVLVPYVTKRNVKDDETRESRGVERRRNVRGGRNV